MCFFSRLTLSVSGLKSRFGADPDPEDDFEPVEEYNGFTFPKTPVIANDKPELIRLFNWGLMPSWAKDDNFRKNTLNARFETLREKPSFRPYCQNRCLVLANGFYEWQWLDPQGRKKQKYLITLENEEAFAFAGIWSKWASRDTGEILNTYSIITVPSTGLMSEIHNSKLRMPFILKTENERKWIEGKDVMFEEINLSAKKLDARPPKTQILFDYN